MVKKTNGLALISGFEPYLNRIKSFEFRDISES